MLAASRVSWRRRKLPRRVIARKRKSKVRRAKFARKVRRALPQHLRSSPPKWHIYRSTAVLTPNEEGGTVLSTGQTALDIAHGTSDQYDGIVALQAVAKMNVDLINPEGTNHAPVRPWGTVVIFKSYMVLYMTNNSATPVYGKMAVIRPRRGVNHSTVLPSALASADIIGPGSNVANEYLNPDALITLDQHDTYAAYAGMTDKVQTTLGVTDMGFIWQNSLAFKRYYKIKMKNITWAPMECKQFRFKMKKPVNMEVASEYTIQPATGTINPLEPPNWLQQPRYYLQPKDTGNSIMARGRGFFVSFLLHGIPARAEDSLSVGLTQPKFDIYWLNAYKYGWRDPNYREYHVNPNPLESDQPSVAIPGFGTLPGPPQTG